jgi:hypothetical protein
VKYTLRTTAGWHPRYQRGFDSATITFMMRGSAPLHENARPLRPLAEGSRRLAALDITGSIEYPRCGLRLAPRAALAWGGPAQTLRIFTVMDPIDNPG